MSDLLRIDHINSLPQPFFAHLYGGSEWPVFDIDVETGLLRIDVCGLLDVKHIGDVRFFRDMDGVEHDADSFYNEDEPSNALGQEPCAAVCARSPAPEGYTSGTTEKE